MTRRAASVAIAALALAGCPRSHEYADGRGIEGQLEREIIALQSRVRLLEEEAKTCVEGGKPDSLYATLHQVVPTDDGVRVEYFGPVTQVTLPDDHLFGSDAVSLREEAYVTLDMIATALADRPEYTVMIEGHTADVMPSGPLGRKYASLWDLSYGRATAVRDALVQRFGVPEERLTLVARGPYGPVTSNDTVAGQNQNRRVVVHIYPPGMRK